MSKSAEATAVSKSFDIHVGSAVDVFHGPHQSFDGSNGWHFIRQYPARRIDKMERERPSTGRCQRVRKRR